MTAAPDEPNDRPVIAREAVYAVLDGGRTREEAIEYFGVTAAEYYEALAVHIERTQLKNLTAMAEEREARKIEARHSWRHVAPGGWQR